MKREHIAPEGECAPTVMKKVCYVFWFESGYIPNVPMRMSEVIADIDGEIAVVDSGVFFANISQAYFIAKS